MTLIYNLVLAAVAVGAVRFLWKKPTLTRWAAAVGGLAAAAMFFAVAAVAKFGSRWGFDSFHVAGLLSYAIFLYGTLLLAASGLIFWRVSKRMSLFCGAAAGGLALVAFDAFVVEPTWLEVSRIEIASPKLSRPVRIVVLADLQTDACGEYERGVLRLAVDQRPDLILWAGDYVQTAADEAPAVQAAINAVLRELDYQPPLGAYAVCGNVDWPAWPEMFAATGVTAVAETQSFDLDGLRVTCLSLADSLNPRLHVPSTRHEPDGESPAAFHIVVGHVPNFALGMIDADLLVAGHTHGGQVQLPCLGPIVTNAGIPRAWADGVTQLSDDRTLVVSRGIGMERGQAPRLRFLCRPQILVIDLKPGETSSAEPKP